MTPEQKAQLNALLSQFPSTSSRPAFLADLWEQVTGPVAQTFKNEWKAETQAKVDAAKVRGTQNIDNATDAIGSA